MNQSECIDEIIQNLRDDTIATQKGWQGSPYEAKAAIEQLLVKARIDEWQQLQDENNPPCVTTYKQQRIAELEKQLKDRHNAT